MTRNLFVILSLLVGSTFALPAPLVAQGDLAKLIQELGDPKDSQLRYAAYRKLLATKPPKAMPLLVKALPGFSVNAVSLAMSLMQSYPRDIAQPALRKLVTCGNPVVEIGSATILHRYGDKSQGERIARLLREAPVDYQTRQLMLSRLSYLKDPRVQDAVRAWIRPGIKSQELDTVLYHLLLVEDVGAADAVQQLLDEGNKTASSLEPATKILLETFLLARGRKAGLDSMAKAIESASTSDFSRLQKYLSRAEHLDRKILAAVAVFLENNLDQYTASYAMQILGKHGYRKALPTIRKLLGSSNQQVSKAAFEALRDLGGMSDKSSLYQLLDSEHIEIALSAADTLRRLDDHTGMARVLEIVKKGGSTRSEAVRVLAEFRDPKVVLPLLVALEDKDRNVRTQALSGLDKVFRCLYPYKRIDLSTCGYSVDGGATKRAVAISNIRAWWGRLHQKR